MILNTSISLIAAIGKNNRAIGKNNHLLWNLPSDLKRFRELTTGHPIIMGYNTFKSIGRALPNRTNIVLNTEPLNIPNVTVCSSLEKAIEVAGRENNQEIFVIGGGMVYSQAINLADRLYLTLVDDNSEGDTHFPDYSPFSKIIDKEDHEENGLKFSFVTLERT